MIVINKIIIKPKNINLINCISFLYFFTINDLNYYKINKLVMDISVQPSVPEDQIFKLYFKYRQSSFNKTISSNDLIYKFKERVINYEKIFREIQKQKFKQRNPNEIVIYVKENNQKKLYTESNSENEKCDETKTSNQHKESNSEPNLLEIQNNEEKKKEEVSNQQRSFIVLGGYSDIAKALVKRGWKQIKDPTDTSFDYIYPLKAADIKFVDLRPNQMAGHFWKANEITRKAGLTKNIRNLYFKGVNVDNFFPRAYELSEKNDLEDFIEDFKTSKALGILKECVQRGGKNSNKEIVLTSLDIVKRKAAVFTEEVDIDNRIKTVKQKTYGTSNISEEEKNKLMLKLVTDEEWAIIGEEDMEFYNTYVEKLQRIKFIAAPEGKNLWKNKTGVKSSGKKKVIKKEKKVTEFEIDTSHKSKPKINEEEKKKKEEFEKEMEREKERIKEEEEKYKKELEEKEKQKEKKEKEEKEKKEKEKEEGKEEDEHDKYPPFKEHQRPPKKPMNDDMSSYVPEISSLLNKIKPFFAQFTMDGSKNIWIAKPGGLSRGRGVHCVDQLNDILANVKIGGQTIIQKYIENPLIILGRKFDIRQWVLVTDLSPLTVWLFDTPYLRFGAEDYDPNDIKNVYSNLTNNSIAKHSEHFNDTQIEGDMWEIEQFREFLVKKYGKDYWPEIQEKIKKIVIYSLQSAKHKIFQRKNCHEVFGYDLMIDEKLNVYLIEINASPDWTYSTKVTEKLIKIASDDIIKVVVDYADNMKKEEKDRKEIETGRMKLIFNGNDFPKYDNMNVNIDEVNHI